MNQSGVTWHMRNPRPGETHTTTNGVVWTEQNGAWTDGRVTFTIQDNYVPGVVMNKETRNEFEQLARPLVKFLNDKFDPHTEIIIDIDSARIVSGECGIPITDYLKD